MKENQFINANLFKLIFTSIVIIAIVLFSSCDDDDPEKENVPELITKVILTFTPVGGGSAIVATASDPDGEGVQNIAPDGPVNLSASTSYTLTLSLINELAGPSDPEYNITEEVKEEADEHMFFYSWTNDVFSDPAGDGNIDNRSDDVNYEDEDNNSLPLGLETSWTTATASSGTLRIVLKHQPDLKSASSSSSVGETDLDISFTIDIQ